MSNSIIITSKTNNFSAATVDVAHAPDVGHDSDVLDVHADQYCDVDDADDQHHHLHQHAPRGSS